MLHMGQTQSVSLGICFTLLAVSSAVGQVDPDCCALAHTGPGCSDAGCSAAVCAELPGCCSAVWDEGCVSAATNLCAALFNDCDGVPGFDGCYLGPAYSAVTVPPIDFNNPDGWTNGVPGRATSAEFFGSVGLGGCDHSVSQFTNQLNQFGFLALQGHSLEVGTLAHFTNIHCQGPGHLNVAALVLDPLGSLFFDNLSIQVNGDFRLGPGSSPAPSWVTLGQLFPVSIECHTFIPDNGPGGIFALYPGSTLTVLDTNELVLETGRFTLGGTTELGGPLRIMPAVDFEASGTFRTPVFRNDGEMVASLWSGFNSSMVVEGDFENDPGPNALGIDGIGTLHIETCCATPQTMPLIDVTGEASLGGLCALWADGWLPDYMEVVRAGSLNPARSGFDGLSMFLAGGLPPGQAPRFVRSQDAQGRQIVGIELVPVQSLAFAPQTPAALLWEPQRNAAFDFGYDGFDDHAIALRNTSTGESALRVYLNQNGVIGADYIPLALPATAVDLRSIPSSFSGEPQLLVATAPDGLLRVRGDGEALGLVGLERTVPLPAGTDGLVAATALRTSGTSGRFAAVSTSAADNFSFVQYLAPSGSAQWQVLNTVTLAGRATCAAAGDLDLDGTDEVIVACDPPPSSPTGRVYVLFGQTATVTTHRGLNGSPRGVVVSPVDDDPFPEIVVVNVNPQSVVVGTFQGSPIVIRASAEILRNGGAAAPGSLVATVPLDVGASARDIVAVDPDRDLDSDFAVVTGASGPGQLVSIRNDSSAGSLVFGTPLVEASADGAIAVASAHFRPGRRADLLVLENHPLGLLGPDWNGNGLGGMGGGVDGDLDGNGDVDGTDLSMLLGNWNTADQTADIDADGIVSGGDLAILLGNW